MSEMKLSLLDKRIAQFCESSRELLTDIHTRKKGGMKNMSKEAGRMQTTISITEPDIDVHDEEYFGI